MSLKTFNTVLLSAVKTGTPNLIGTALSASGVNTISLSTDDIGIAFTAKTTLNSILSTVNVLGSVFRIDTAYSGESLALVRNGTYNVFTFTSGDVGTIPVSAFSVTTSVSTPDTRRKRHLGY